MKTRLAALIALAVILTLALATTAGAKPQSLDSYCSPTGDFCQEITLNKSGIVKFALPTFSFSGEYTICVKGSNGQALRGFRARVQRGDTYSDKVNWQRNFPDESGTYKVDLEAPRREDRQGAELRRRAR